MRRRGCKVIDRRETERIMVPGHDPDILMFRPDLIIVFKRSRILAIVFRDEDLIVVPGRFLKDRSKAARQHILLILVWNNNGNLWFTLHRINTAEAPDILGKLHLRRNTQAVIVLLHRPLPALIGVHLAFRISRRGLFISSPVVEELRHMHDLPRLLAAPEDKIVILRPVKLTTLKTAVR